MFLCPCCQKEHITVFFQPTPYVEQRKMVEEFLDTDDLWIPYPAFTQHQVNHEKDLERITIRPSIDVSQIGHKAWFISNGEVEEARDNGAGT
jgi:hypothetical protein